MGIKNLLKFLNEFPGIIDYVNIDDIKGKKVAIDISVLLYQVVISIRSSGADLKNKNGDVTSHILGLFNKTILLLSRRIIPVYVFDGKPSIMKSNVLNYRKEIRNKALEKLKLAKTNKEKIKYFKRSLYITNKQYKECQNLLDVMGIPYVISPEEADSQCAYLSRNNLVDYVLTEDMDILTFGSNNIIRNLASHKKSPVLISLDNILKRLNFSYENFVDFCILLGCDYCKGLRNIKVNIIFEYYSKYKDFNETLNNLKKDGYNIQNIQYYSEIKEYFIKGKNFKEVDKSELYIKKSNKNNLLNLLVNKYGLVRTKIDKKVELLLNYHENFLTDDSISGYNILI